MTSDDQTPQRQMIQRFPNALSMLPPRLADAIADLEAENERLRSENERLRAEAKIADRQLDGLQAENDRLRAEYDRLRIRENAGFWGELNETNRLLKEIIERIPRVDQHGHVIASLYAPSFAPGSCTPISTPTERARETKRETTDDD